MTCVVVTRGGWGSVLKFENRSLAFVHPVVQYGDAFVEDPESVALQYNRLEWNRLALLANVPSAVRDDLLSIPRREADAWRAQTAARIYTALVNMASPPPSSVETISAMVATDRTHKEKRMTVETTADIDEAPVKEKITRKTYDFHKESIIHFGVRPDTKDAEGNVVPGTPYSTDSGPYRAESKREKRWKELRDGMTVEEAMKGLTTGKNINDMRNRGFIVLETPEGLEDLSGVEATGEDSAE